MSALLVCLIIGLLVIAHEYGHLLAGRAAGVKIAAFAVGLGPRVASIRRGDTE